MTEAERTRPPRRFYVWLVGALASTLGDAVMYFALGWAASAHGGAVAGLVLTAINLPRACLLLVGGTVADRWGARRIMIIGDAAMLVGTAALAIVSGIFGPALWLLIGTGLLVGIKDAFYLPASGTMPLRLVGRSPLPRAMAMRQSGTQAMTMIAGPLAGTLMAYASLTAAAALNAVTFAAIVVALVAVKPLFDIPPKPDGGFLHDTTDGLRTAAKDPVLRAAVLLTGGVAGFLLPVLPLLVPLMARQQGWPATRAGLLFGAQSLALLLTTLVVVKRGTYARPGAAACAGLLTAAVGVALLAVPAHVAVSMIAAAIVGVGSAVCASHIGPLVLLRAPQSHVGRVQALLVLVQSVALLAMNNVLGILADVTTPIVALLTSAAAIALIGVAGLSARRLREAAPEEDEPAPATDEKPADESAIAHAS
ncbi:MAG: major facilitator superfamily 1 [Mycobacterium sp.]|nr:major facilitator superfamily 1 [Mycobacterium sp.]